MQERLPKRLDVHTNNQKAFWHKQELRKELWRAGNHLLPPPVPRFEAIVPSDLKRWISPLPKNSAATFPGNCIVNRQWKSGIAQRFNSLMSKEVGDRIFIYKSQLRSGLHWSTLGEPYKTPVSGLVSSELQMILVLYKSNTICAIPSIILSPISPRASLTFVVTSDSASLHYHIKQSVLVMPTLNVIGIVLSRSMRSSKSSQTSSSTVRRLQSETL